MNFVNTVLSKRKLTWFVEQKLVEVRLYAELTISVYYERLDVTPTYAYMSFIGLVRSPLPHHPRLRAQGSQCARPEELHHLAGTGDIGSCLFLHKLYE